MGCFLFDLVFGFVWLLVFGVVYDSALGLFVGGLLEFDLGDDLRGWFAIGFRFVGCVG